MSAIDELWDFAGDIAEPCHWLGGDEADPSEDYCEECGEKAVEEGLGEFLDGGWGVEEADGCRHCCRCAVLLAYVLTDHGAKAELSHFREYGVAGPLSRDEAYHVAALAAALPDDLEVRAIAEKAAGLPRDSGGQGA